MGTPRGTFPAVSHADHTFDPGSWPEMAWLGLPVRHRGSRFEAKQCHSSEWEYTVCPDWDVESPWLQKQQGTPAPTWGTAVCLESDCVVSPDLLDLSGRCLLASSIFLQHHRPELD
jgi:hypothetical protein